MVLSPAGNSTTPRRLAESVLAVAGEVTSTEQFDAWWTGCRRWNEAVVRKAPLEELDGWLTDRSTGNIVHRTGKFFSVEGLEVEVAGGPVQRWSQPIINQPEVGLLGILIKDFGGILHCLMQAKVEPGNPNGAQIAPTVQATRSNYTRVHQGKAVPYLEYFRDRGRTRRVLADVRQSEQGAWFHHKRNRNTIVEVEEDVKLLDGFCWLTVGQVHQLLAVDDLVNMDARTVLSCLPLSGDGVSSGQGEDFRSCLERSCAGEHGGLHTTGEILNWITEIRTTTDVGVERVPLNGLVPWSREAGEIAHPSGRFFRVVGVDVRAGGREVGNWMQPMIEPIGTGLVAFLVKRVDGVLHVLMHARVEPGYLDIVELAPTVQCTPENYDVLPSAARPEFLDEVLRASAGQIRFEAVLAEEGGRFFRARNRYLLVETDLAVPPDAFPRHRWMTMSQITGLLRHSHYVNIQARSLVACLHSLLARADTR
ncbi:NDP-hexose 2,3-dehydratase family protein [Amycolatopsis rubida]|uniref:Oxidase EvaA n=1 Tax=Amycolatopsis rubida TaxID=112413 RepID=A0A1I5TIE0_9PSEU|nr:NDP-hexose 2,3-dehydratase family protein [Amycolatopsis rubida]SFP82795.1 oxidase EvaA [Amycolatopsis rubida]